MRSSKLSYITCNNDIVRFDHTYDSSPISLVSLFTLDHLNYIIRGINIFSPGLGVDCVYLRLCLVIPAPYTEEGLMRSDLL